VLDDKTISLLRRLNYVISVDLKALRVHIKPGYSMTAAREQIARITLIPVSQVRVVIDEEGPQMAIDEA